jgi:hypothetical protein
MSRPIDKENVKALLENVPDATVREMCIEGLRRWHRREPAHNHIQMHGTLGRELVPQLLTRAQRTVSADEQNQLKEPFIDAQDEAWMAPVTEFIWWFIGCGFAAPTVFAVGNLVDMRLTRRGVAFLEAPADHPQLPGYLARLVARCRNLPDGVIELLTDASDCLEHGLRRPGIVLMGVAYELAIETVVESLITRGHLPASATDLKPAMRINAVRGTIDSVLPGTTPQEKDDRHATRRAYDFADDLRRRRNDASHTTPRYPFNDPQEAEEYFVSAGRNLPLVWSMA